MKKIRHLSRQVYRTAWGVSNLRKDDIWLSSFPRSGNTWFRNILASIYGISQDRLDIVDLCNIHRLVPSLGLNDLSEAWVNDVLPRFVKTHKNYWPVLFAAPRRTLLLVRDPRASAVSYYKLCCSSTILNLNLSFDQFLRHRKFGLEAWARHYRTWQPHATSIIYFEDLRNDTANVVARGLGELGLQFPPELIQAAVEHSSIDRMRELEASVGVRDPSRFKEGFRTVGQGKLDGWKEYFHEENLDYYRSFHAKHNLDIYDPPCDQSQACDSVPESGVT